MPRNSCSLRQVVCNFRGREDAEGAVGADDAYLDVLAADLAFEALLQRQYGGVHRILKLHVVTVSLLKERLGVGHVLAYCRRLPRKVRAAGVHLVQLRPCVVVARNQERDAERPHAAVFGE